MERKKKNYVYVLYLESNVDGEIYFDTEVCDCLRKARKALKEEKDWVLKESCHFNGYQSEELGENFEIEESKNRFFINDPCDDYYEDYKIVRKEVK